jgi:tyrosinase
MANKKNLLLLLDRPGEPIFYPKGDNNAVFDVPNNFLEERFQSIGPELQSRFGDDAGERVTVQNTNVPNLNVPMQLGKQENFSLFVPRHRKLASALTDVFLSKLTILVLTALK